MALLVRRRGCSLLSDQTLGTRAGIHQDVRWPAKHLMEDQGSDGDDRGISGRVVHDLLQESGVRLSFRFAVRYKDGIFLHVVVVAVMTRVAELPAEERDHQDTVQEPASNSIDGEISRKGVVAAVVRKNPETSEEATLNEAVNGPERHGNVQRRIELRELDGGVEERAHDDEIANDVGERPEHGTLEAMGGNGIFQGLHIRNRGWLDIGHRSEPGLDRRNLNPRSCCDHCQKREE